MAVSTQEQAVLYVDLLGFADMTLTSEEIPVRVPPYETGNWQEDYGAGAPNFWTEKSPISYRLLTFHRRLENLLHHAARRSELRAMLFSDGAFVVRPDMRSLAPLARQIMQTCVLHKIPVRMGLATGTFQPLKFGADTIGEVGIYTSLFYGTGVVRAHYAESTGGKGMRILVHPSVASNPSFVSDGIDPDTYEHPNYKLLPLLEPSEHAGWELDYLYRGKGKPWFTSKINVDEEDQKLWDAVNDMQSRAPATPAVQRQYIETRYALNFMRTRLDRVPFETTPISTSRI